MEKTTLYLPAELQRRLRETDRLGALRQDPAKGRRVDARDAKRWVRQR